MNNEQLYQHLQILAERLAEHRKTGVLTFKDLDEKAMLKTTYQSIYGNIQMDLNCPSCILHYMNNLIAWYDRNRPKEQPIEQVIKQETTQEGPQDPPAEVKKPIRKKNK